MLHGVGGERFHLVQLGGGGRAIVIADDGGAELAGTDVGAEVQRRALLFETAEIAIEIRPINGEFVGLKKRLHGRESFFTLRGDGGAFAGDFRGDALREFAERAIIEEQADFGLPQHVYKSWRDDATGSVDFAGGAFVVQIADRRDSIAFYGNVGVEPGISRAVDEVAIANDQVIRGVERSVVGCGRNFAEGLPCDAVRGIWIGRERDVIYVRREGQLLATLREDVPGQSLAAKPGLAVEAVASAERAGLSENVTGGGRFWLNFREGAIFAEDRQRVEKHVVIRTGRPVEQIAAREVGAEIIGCVAACAISLRCGGEIELGSAEENRARL